MGKRFVTFAFGSFGTLLERRLKEQGFNEFGIHTFSPFGPEPAMPDLNATLRAADIAFLVTHVEDNEAFKIIEAAAAVQSLGMMPIAVFVSSSDMTSTKQEAEHAFGEDHHLAGIIGLPGFHLPLTSSPSGNLSGLQARGLDDLTTFLCSLSGDQIIEFTPENFERLFRGSTVAWLCGGSGTGPAGTVNAAKAALSTSVSQHFVGRASNILVSVSGGPRLTMTGVNEAVDTVRDHVLPAARVEFCLSVKEAHGEEATISLLFDEGAEARPR